MLNFVGKCWRLAGRARFRVLMLLMVAWLPGGFTSVNAQGADAAGAPPASPINLLHSPVRAADGSGFLPWDADSFFAQAATRMLRDQLGVDLAQGIEIWPHNQYNTAVHRLLQVAANIYDATTNQVAVSGAEGSPRFPTVYQPWFRRTETNIVIAGYTAVTNAAEFQAAFLDSTRWHDMDTLAGRDNFRPGDFVPGVPVIVGAQKGWPNFNEFALQTIAQVSRKLVLTKSKYSDFRASFTNQYFVVSISNILGVELWNSYTQYAHHPLQIDAQASLRCSLRDEALDNELAVTNCIFNISTNYQSWFAQEFKLPLAINQVWFTNQLCVANPTRWLDSLTNAGTSTDSGWSMPNLALFSQAQLRLLMIDSNANRVVDCVNLSPLTSALDISRVLVGNTNDLSGYNIEGAFWQTNISAFGVPSGVQQQMLTSLGLGTNNNSIWINSSDSYLSGDARYKAIDLFRVFLGITPIRYPRYQLQQELSNSVVQIAPFSPARKICQYNFWQANDPLVHYLADDLLNLDYTNIIQYVVPITKAATNSNLGQLNRRYRPWGGNPRASSDLHACDARVKDPFVSRSDYWQFPTNGLNDIGALGQVHRGTPWQTLYMKSAAIPMAEWIRLNSGVFSLIPGSQFTHPTNDWRLFDLFTVSDDPLAGLSPNSADAEAWAKVFQGMAILTNTYPFNRGYSNFLAGTIQEGSPELQSLVDSVALARIEARHFNGLGDLLAIPQLSLESPYLKYLGSNQVMNCTEEVLECIPRQLLPLLHRDPPQFPLAIAHLAVQRCQITWNFLPGQHFAVQKSADLVHWETVETTVTESADGEYSTDVEFPASSSAGYLRVLWPQ